jgi:hypothetical protein
MSEARRSAVVNGADSFLSKHDIATRLLAAKNCAGLISRLQK